MTKDKQKEEIQLRTVALRNAQSILSARRRAEEQLLQAKTALELTTSDLAHSLAMLHATLEASTDAILVTNNNGEVMSYNEKYTRFWKIPKEVLAQRKHRALLDYMASQFKDPQAFIDRVHDIYVTSPTETFDILHLLNGCIWERHTRMQFVKGENVGRVWTFRDVTEQYRAEDALREESRMLELLNHTGMAIASKLDLDTLLQEVTDAATSISGAEFGAFFYNTTDADGDSLMLYTLSGASPDAFKNFKNPRATALFGPTFRGEDPIRSDDILKDPRYGKSAPHHGMPPGHLPVRSYLAVPVISRSGEVIGGLFFGHSAVGVFTERSERLMVGVAAQAAVAIDNSHLYEQAQNAAKERARLLASERSARQIAEEQNRSKDTFIAMLGHELRNPLSAISASVAVIDAAGPASEMSSRAYDIIKRQSTHLERIVNDLLDAARMLAGKITLEKARVELDEAVKACVHALETSGRANGYTLRMQLQPVCVEADPARIDQIIGNLITNALKYTQVGGEITISITVEGEETVLAVADNGMGIPPDLIGKVFDPFVQGERSLARSQGGLGIGLTLVRQLAVLHGGNVSVSSPGEGLGSTFKVSFPIADAVVNTKANPNAHAPGQQGQVLVIEDNPDALEMTSVMLELAAYRVLQARNGMQGLELARTHHPAVAIIDIGLPDLNGYDVARRLRADRSTRHIRLIALSGYGAPEDHDSAYAAGFEMHLVKPVNFDRLISAVENSPREHA